MIGHPNYQKKLAGVTEKNSWDDCIKEICQCGLKSLIKKLHSMLSMSLKKASCLIKAEKLNCWFSMDNNNNNLLYKDNLCIVQSIGYVLYLRITEGTGNWERDN